MIDAIKTLLQMEFMQLEFVQEEIKDKLEDLKERNSLFDKEFDMEQEKVSKMPILYSIFKDDYLMRGLNFLNIFISFIMIFSTVKQKKNTKGLKWK